MDWSKDFDLPAGAGNPSELFYQAGSNLVLDFHGDPCQAELVVFSDGNHNMALKETLIAFGKEQPGLTNYFYATTPPRPILSMIRGKPLRIGNLTLSVKPHVFIGPTDILYGLEKEGYVFSPELFVENQGNVLIVKKGNPKGIKSIQDLLRNDVILFLSNPETEKASFKAYSETLANLSGYPDIISRLNILYGSCIHHREAPISITDRSADAAIVFYHLGRHFLKKFPHEFEMISLGGSIESLIPLEGNVIGRTSVASTTDPGDFGEQFIRFLFSKTTAAVYRKHGLIPLFQPSSI